MLFFSACNSQKKVIFRPDPIQIQTDPFEIAEIIDTQGGPPSASLPEWVILYLGIRTRTLYSESIRIRQIEALDAYRNTYIFVGKNRGANFAALRQWADRFTVAQDFPRLAAERIENRLLSGAALYPDDEYGEFFEVLVKKAYDADYPQAVKRDTFWIKRRVSESVEEMAEQGGSETAENTSERELYEFFVLISIEKNAFQGNVQELLANTRTTVRPTRDQTAAINLIKLNFFEGF